MNKHPGTKSKSIYPVVLWLVLFISVASALQCYTAVPFDDDTAYHVAVGRLIAQHGILHSFPWTEFSWLNDNYADKELLFHLLFVPLNRFNWVTASKIIGAIATTLTLFSFYLVLRTEDVWNPGLWAFLPLTASTLFLLRMAVVRPYVLVIGLTVIMLWAAAKQRHAILGIVALLFPWIYVAFWQLPAIVLFSAEAARLFSGRQLRWKPATTVTLGISVGVMLHPNSVNLLGISWVNMMEMFVKNTLGGHDRMIMGMELHAFSWSQWLAWMPATVVMGISGSIVAWRDRRHDDTTLAFAVATLIFAILTLRSGKFADYFTPFSVVTMALASRRIQWHYLPQTLMILSIACSLLFGVKASPWIVSSLATRQDEVSPMLAKVMRSQIPVGAHIFTTEWDRTGRFMLELPDRYFLVALDPTFFSAKDPERYSLWKQLIFRPPPDAAEIIRSRFGSDFLIGSNEPKNHLLLLQLNATPGVRLLYVDDNWALFDLKE